MTQEIFAPMDAIRFGWDGLKKNLRFFVVLMIIVAALYVLPSLIWMGFFSVPEGTPSTLGVFLMSAPIAILSMVIYLTVELGLLKIALSFRDNKTLQIEDLFRGYPLLLNYLAASIIYGLMVAGGFILLSVGGFILGQGAGMALIAIVLVFIPLGIYLSLKYQFYGYLIVDKGMGPIEALQQSARLTEGALKNLLIFWLVWFCGIIVTVTVLIILIAIPVGILASFMPKYLLPVFLVATNLVSFLVIVPITNLATAYIYRALEAHSAASASGMPAPEADESVVDVD